MPGIQRKRSIHCMYCIHCIHCMQRVHCVQRTHCIHCIQCFRCLHCIQCIPHNPPHATFVISSEMNCCQEGHLRAAPPPLQRKMVHSSCELVRKSAGRTKHSRIHDSPITFVLDRCWTIPMAPAMPPKLSRRSRQPSPRP